MIEVKRKIEGITLQEFWNKFNTSRKKLVQFIQTALKYGFVYTHSGKEFHADEVFALALLDLYRIKLNKDANRTIYTPFKIIRDRGIKDKRNVLFIDVDESVFDHHFPKNEAAFRENGVQYASAGLMWAVLGKEFLPDEYVNAMDEAIFQSIDACDNGQFATSEYSSMIASFVPNWNEPRLNLEIQMALAIDFAKTIISRRLASFEAIVFAKEEVQKVYENTKDKRIIILPQAMNWQSVLVPTEAQFVIWKSDNTFCCQAVPVEVASFDLKTPFYKEWRGFRNEELKRISELNLIFCHSTGFYLVAETLEDAVKACLISLEKKG